MRDLGNTCLVLCADTPLWRDVFRPAVRMASLSDGRGLLPVRVDPDDAERLRSDEVLDVLEYGALLLVDLVDVDAATFPLVSWTAQAHPASTLLFRHGTMALPFELHELLVRSFELPHTPEAATGLRVSVGSLATLGANARDRELGLARTTPRDNLRVHKRREERGVAAALREAARALLDGALDDARAAMVPALAAEPRSADLRVRAALLDRRAGRWGEALQHLERAVRYDPRDAAAWRELGVVREQVEAAGIEDALREAIRLGSDFEAMVALALRLARRGETDESVRLLERAMQVSGGQLNLVLPALEARALRDERLALLDWERARLEEVVSIRHAQAARDPPADAPWSHFDAARALTLLGREDEAAAVLAAAREHLSAPWQTQTFGRSLEAFAAAGIDVAPLADALGTSRRRDEAPAARAAAPPFRAAVRDAAWFAENVPCMTACPVGTDAGAYVHLLAQGRHAEAFHVARAPNPFASVCGRICAAPCEDACRRGHVDEPVEIRSLKRFLNERHGVEGVEPRVDDVLRAGHAPCIEGEAYVTRVRHLDAGGRKGRVAVVGGGPAGLACAHDLAVLGHAVTVFEASHALGGMMRQGIPIYRLSRDLIELEIGAILSLGVEVELGRGLHAGRTVGALFDEGFDAVFLGSGAGRGRDLDVEGAHLDGVVRAIDFLLNANMGYRMELGRSVVVVGGGNVALDVARTARLGRAPDPATREAAGEEARHTFGPALPGRELRKAVRGRERDVHVLARQPLGRWPAQRTVRGAEEFEEARREGIVFHPLRGVRRFLGANGRLTGVELAEVVQVYDARGRYRPMYGPHLAEVIPCDTAFLAVGQEPALDYLEGTEVTRSSWGLIEVDDDLATTMPGVYAGGDAAFGPRTLIEAVGDGKHAARSIHARLTRGARPRMRATFEAIPARCVPTAADYDVTPRRSPPSRALERRTGVAEVELGFDEAEARRQAGRCLVCHVQTVYDGDLCIACGRCTDVCPFACLSFVAPEAADVAGLVRADIGPADVLMLKDEDACIRCGLCAERCPTGAMTMERFHMTAEGPA